MVCKDKNSSVSRAPYEWIAQALIGLSWAVSGQLWRLFKGMRATLHRTNNMLNWHQISHDRLFISRVVGNKCMCCDINVWFSWCAQLWRLRPNQRSATRVMGVMSVPNVMLLLMLQWMHGWCIHFEHTLPLHKHNVHSAVNDHLKHATVVACPSVEHWWSDLPALVSNAFDGLSYTFTLHWSAEMWWKMYFIYLGFWVFCAEVADLKCTTHLLFWLMWVMETPTFLQSLTRPPWPVVDVLSLGETTASR